MPPTSRYRHSPASGSINRPASPSNEKPSGPGRGSRRSGRETAVHVGDVDQVPTTSGEAQMLLPVSNLRGGRRARVRASVVSMAYRRPSRRAGVQCAPVQGQRAYNRFVGLERPACKPVLSVKGVDVAVVGAEVDRSSRSTRERRICPRVESVCLRLVRGKDPLDRRPSGSSAAIFPSRCSHRASSSSSFGPAQPSGRRRRRSRRRAPQGQQRSQLQRNARACSPCHRMWPPSMVCLVRVAQGTGS